MSSLSGLVGTATKVAKTTKKKKQSSTPSSQATRADITAKRQQKTQKRNEQAKLKIGEQMDRQREAYAKASKSVKPQAKKPKPMRPSEAKNMGQLLRSKPKKNARSMYNAARGNDNPDPISTGKRND